MLAALCGIASLAQAAQEFYQRHPTWVATLQATRTALREARLGDNELAQAVRRAWRMVQDDFPVEWDWSLQDGPSEVGARLLGDTPAIVKQLMLDRAMAGPLSEGSTLPQQWKPLKEVDRGSDDLDWLNFYVRACQERRTQRLASVRQLAPRIVFMRKPTLRPSFFAYTEGQSDAQNERHFIPGSALCLLEETGSRGRVVPLVEDPTGALRDPAVSWDATRVLFAWKKSLDDDDYHLYELHVARGDVRQITRGLGFADYEGAYLPNGDLIFASTRCVQTVDCWWTEASNLYTCDSEGRYLRRLGFDQVHSIHPAVLEDGRVIYTRWDYNDRGQIFPQALFQMNPDGTAQQEFYGNSSWFPTTIAHARGIPGTQKVLAIFCGHHTAQTGKLGLIDPARGRQETEGAQLVAPVRTTKAERIDAYGQEGDLFQHPFPLTQTEFLVGYAPLGWSWRNGHFGLYWMDLNGRRELLASDPQLSCSQPVPLVARRPPATRPSLVDYRKTEGTCYLQDVYAGPGLAGIPRGTIRRLRVVALEFRPAGLGANYNNGPAGGALVSTPIAIGNGSWDVKVVLGETPVHDDGSAFFRVPARTPIYFQALDARGRAVQTMRSWTTLQPGENQSCVGCHDAKNASPPIPGSLSQALRSGPQSLEPFQGPPRSFSFNREIQPILDQHCVRCHYDRSQQPPSNRPPQLAALNHRVHQNPDHIEPAFSLSRDTVEDTKSKRHWSDAYLALTGARRQDLPWDRDVYVGNPGGRLVNWVHVQSAPEPLPPRSAGALRSELLDFLEQRHAGAQLSRDELARIACWIDLLVPYCGDYAEASAWSPEEHARFQHYQRKRASMQALERENIAALLQHPAQTVELQKKRTRP